MFRSIVIIIVGLIAGVLILAATKPDVFRVERRATLQAPPEAVFAQINDFKRWEAWSPWEKKDPAMKRSFGATTAGKGATYAWEGNSEVGQGSMQIVESAAPSRVALKLDFLKPFEAHNDVEFTLVPNAAGTDVIWAMQGPNPYFAKVLHVFMDMDRMVGQDFEAGLANLKTQVEKPREKTGATK
jgi:uncharacterized protein YndB with AHSA1/START domain